jgi:hypothetical protein
VFVGNAAEISGGGLLLSGTVEQPSDVFNSLFVRNNAQRDGGGASVNWLSRVNFGNCTFADNIASDLSGLFDSYGGGVFVGTNSKASVQHGIFWNNTAKEGSQVSIGTSSDFDDPAELTISHSLVGGYPNLHSLYKGTGAVLNVGDDVFTANPQFVSPTDIDPSDRVRKYFLNQNTSPAVDRGSVTAASVGLDGYTTSVYGGRDKGAVDLGYHYQFARQSDCAKIDESLILSGKIDLDDMASFLIEWLSEDCVGPYWCNGSDLNFDGFVNFEDLAALTLCWDAEDTEAPNKGKIAWAAEPQIDSEVTGFAIKMAATPVQDNWWPYRYPSIKNDPGSPTLYGVMYMFDCIEPADGFDSGWQPGTEFKIPNQMITSLPLNRYTYQLIAKDGSGNVTEPAPVKTVAPVLPQTVWARAPFVNGQNRVEMEIAPVSGTTGSGVDWGYTFMVGSRTFLLTERTFIYPPLEEPVPAPGTVLSIAGKIGLYKSDSETGLEMISEALPTDTIQLTFVPGDLNPPLPNPAQHTATSPFQFLLNGKWHHVVTAVPAVDIDALGEEGDEHVNVEYKFVCVGNSEYSSGGQFDRDRLEWRNLNNVAGLYYHDDFTPQVPNQYWVPVGVQSSYSWYIIVRDQSPAQNQTIQSITKQVQAQ